MSKDDALFSRFGKHFPKGSIIFQEDEKGEFIFIIQDGEVQLTKKIRNTERLLSLLGKGEFFGEMAIFNNQPRTATATALVDTKLILLDKSTFEHMVRDNKEIALRIIKKLSARLEDANNRIENLLIPDSTTRVVNVIFKGAKRKTSEGDRGVKIDLNLTITELAGLVGLEESMVNQILNKLKRSGVIFEKAGKICVTSTGMLEKYIKYLEMKNQFEGAV
ncbi:MAG: hypothetical protein A2161_05355 [Candidatus Schekmanbacteria bacterium RBG_13_48_7]|uniref:Cyclic nucleotide-binding domain-containing protein n=1 Tax=Candidatus Schekmanbacteria bacterium RBG_13_48_7 TaxID=1817878 RepID=A0A1F7S3B6_9BACT|nr:MAG: hypothetical protein A2161_05355 [Candidatus Schekmanbacteria bacterium RBG_13_48_7]